jgi:hypothetical protein
MPGRLGRNGALSGGGQCPEPVDGGGTATPMMPADLQPAAAGPSGSPHRRRWRRARSWRLPGSRCSGGCAGWCRRCVAGDRRRLPVPVHAPQAGDALATLVGAVPGGAAALDRVQRCGRRRGLAAGAAALALFAIMFIWQVPHFLAIAWMYREDYARGGYRVLAVLDPDGAKTQGRWWRGGDPDPARARSGVDDEGRARESRTRCWLWRWVHSTCAWRCASA